MEPNSRTRRRRFWVLLLAPVLGLVLTDIGLGVWYRDALPPDGYPWPPFELERHPEYEMWVDPESKYWGRRRVRGVFDAELGWTNRPSAKGTEQGQGATNSQGARGRREYAPQPPAGVLRLGCFGESFTFGSEVNDAQSWPAQIERLDARVEAPNFGIAAYGLDQSLLRFRRHRQRLAADVIVIGIQVGGIGRNLARCRYLEFPPSTRILVKPRFRLVDGALELVALPFEDEQQLLESALAGDTLARISEHEYWRGDRPWIPGSTLCRLWSAHRAVQRRDYQRLWADEDGEPFQLMLALLETFRREALESGSREVLVLLFPDPRDRQARTKEGCAYLDPFRAALAARDFNLIDFDRELAATMSKPGKQARKLFRRAHFTPVGNGIVAGRVLRWLVQQPGLLPERGG